MFRLADTIFPDLAEGALRLELRWYVAQALAGLESTAVHHLSRNPDIVDAYAPAAADRKARYFPGYVFVQLSDPAYAGAVNRTRGVHKLLPIHAASPLSIRSPKFGQPHFVDALRAAIDAGAFAEKRIVETVYNFLENDEVLIDGGPWDGHSGQFLRYHKSCAIVLLACFGSKRELPIPRDVRLLPSGRGARRVGDLVAA